MNKIEAMPESESIVGKNIFCEDHESNLSCQSGVKFETSGGVSKDRA
jgi:hypothetical protein